MFERFTDRARRVLVLAQEEARLLNHNFIGTEHLLLGLVREEDGVAAQALQAMGIRLDAVRAKVKEMVGAPGVSNTASPPFTLRAKKVLELSLREALQLGHNYIGTEHLLLGLVREGEGVAAQVLVNLGAELPRVRHQVIDLLGRYQPSSGQGRPTGAPTVGFRTGRPWRRATTVRPPRQRFVDRPAGSPMTVTGAVELVHREQRLTGTVAGETVDVSLVVPSRDGRSEGDFANAPLAVSWTLAPDETWHPDVPASLHGTFAGAPVCLLGWFHLDADFRFDHGTVEGEVAGAPLAADIDTADGGTLAAHGYFADAGFSLRAADGDGGLEGSVEGAPMILQLERVEGAVPTRTLTGSYEGPLPLLLVLSGALLFFG